MLFDLKWTKQKTILDFLCFLESKPKDETYSYANSYNCAYAQFSGKSVYSRELDEFYPGLSYVLVSSPETFGAAAKRLRELLNKESK